MQINYRPTKRVQLHFTEPTMAKQSFKDECDINHIMAHFEKSGLIDHFNTHQGDYGDFAGVEDYHSSLLRIHAAEAAFMTIPSKIRAQFDNDASKFLAFAQDPNNYDALVDLGLAERQPVEGSPDPETTPLPVIGPGITPPVTEDPEKPA